MRHSVRLEGFRYALRPIREADARFVAALRSDPDLGAYLHRTSGRVEDQEAWLATYFDRAGDYYFIVETLEGAEPVGTVGLYDSDGRAAEWGRWLIAKDAPAAVESALLVYRAAFEAVGLDEVFCRTVAENAKVVSFHDSSGAHRVGTLARHFRLDGVEHDAVEHRVDRSRWDMMRPKLEFLARRLAQH
ncbi:MAG: GNAT family N-acetyltransferase [Alphaproteobacteria bacterium]|nr:GNAT family N-acetyltransferase [Alphaproteobacteria bacterium]MBU1514505.1 GNAT family N-acetyltransferase [Alphaproteobacteria bacterium]MBU2096863.1 GNAT family N-acetyltransferase [Alphaproteobacteria bacterium]MBU2153490.1 GNAT family N-acetyltransferase [Alphaproteobacteria bacterium]MBU2306005.1 GNAT family N-acetyltransferase [Alphaproteobacteria bacterium]